VELGVKLPYPPVELLGADEPEELAPPLVLALSGMDDGNWLAGPLPAGPLADGSPTRAGAGVKDVPLSLSFFPGFSASFLFARPVLGVVAPLSSWLTAVLLSSVGACVSGTGEVADTMVTKTTGRDADNRDLKRDIE